MIWYALEKFGLVVILQESLNGSPESSAEDAAALTRGRRPPRIRQVPTYFRKVFTYGILRSSGHVFTYLKGQCLEILLLLYRL
jgi:hypothetical protein